MNRVLSLYKAHQGKVSDKWLSYLEVYSNLFQPYSDKPVRILEIGIQNGGSLEVWEKYFPNAEVILGCDINPLCSKLKYENPCISVIVGDVISEYTFAKILEISDKFDVIIDDGSHRSDDVIRTFAKYFPLIKEGGLFVAEDLHCSYWDSYQGGIEAPFASINFFKRLSDYVNREHWGSNVKTEEMLSFFSNHYDIHFDSHSLEQITEVRFRNSITAVFKGSEYDNSLGNRVIAGKIANVEKAVIRAAGTHVKSPNQDSNEYGPFSKRLEEIVGSRYSPRSESTTHKHNELGTFSYQQRLEKTERALIRARSNPLVPFGQLIVFYLLKGILKAYLPFSRAGDQWISRKTAKIDPNRLEFESMQVHNEDKQ